MTMKFIEVSLSQPGLRFATKVLSFATKTLENVNPNHSCIGKLRVLKERPGLLNQDRKARVKGKLLGR